MIKTVRKLFLMCCVMGGMLPDSSAQWCATQALNPPPPDAFFRAQRKSQVKSRAPQMRMMGITVFIVEQTVGSSNFDIQSLYDEIDAVNGFYLSSGLQFYLCGSPRFIQGRRNAYTYNQAASDLNDNFHVPNTINIFYLDEIGDNALSIAACGISTFPWTGTPEDRFIIMQKDCSEGGGVLAHEIGHFFGLLHTHETAVGVERVDGSNCETAGDQVCDTPADPNLSASPMQGCNYVGNFIDSNNDPYSPDPSNVMSYAPFQCLRSFSPGQNDRMNFWAEDDGFPELFSDCNFFPDFAISSLQDNFLITSGEVLDIDFDLAYVGVEEASEVDVFFNLLDLNDPDAIPFTLQKEKVLFPPGEGTLSETFQIEIPLARSTGDYTITAVVDPISEYLERDNRNNIVPFDITIDNSGFDDVLLYPNPAEDEVRVFIRDRFLTRNVEIRVVDYLGRVYIEEERFKRQEEFITSVDISALPPGLYLMELTFPDNNEEKEVFRFLRR